MAGTGNSTKKSLNVIIVGCGKVGSTLVEQLRHEGNDVTIIDKNSEKVQTLANTYDVMGVIGNGASFSTQLEAGINKADLFIAVTDSDELNLLCCTVAKRVGNPAAIARVHDPDYSKDTAYLRDKLGLTLIINPEYEAAKEISRILFLPSALEINSFAHGQVEMIKLKIESGNPLDGMAIMNINTLAKEVLICAVERDGEIIIPSGNFVLKAGDKISFVAQRSRAVPFLKNIGILTGKVKNTMIVGGGKVSYYLADQLIKRGISVKIIEKNKARCEQLSVLLPKAVIINGDGTDEDTLNEEGLGMAASFVPLTGIDEENILLTLHARKHSNAKVVTEINRSSFKDVINSLDLGSVVYPRYITSEAIIAYARAKKDSVGSNIETLYHLFGSRAEAIEFSIKESSEVTGIPIKDLCLHKNLLLCFINRNGRIIIPTGNDTIEVGDTVMVMTTHSGFNDIQDILRK